ncbi:MAG: phage holin family protein [Nitrospira sp.]
MAKHEMQQELKKFLKACIQVGVVMILSLMTIILLCLMPVHLLHNVTGLSLWVSYGLVALLVAAGAAGLDRRPNPPTLI